MKAVYGILLGSMALSGCIESDDSDSSESTTSFNGKVADGYLVNAKVCLDLNANNSCDDNEPYATSSAGGAFSLSGVTQSQIDTNPILVEVLAGETYDEDAGDPAIKIETAYKLSAPAGSEFVSPITTILKNKMDNGKTQQTSIDEIKAILGDGFNPARDYVAAKASNELTTEERALYEKGHKIAQAIAGLIANRLNSNEEQGLDDAIDTIEDQLQSLKDYVEQNPNSPTDEVVESIDANILSASNLAGIWVGSYFVEENGSLVLDTSGAIAGAYIFNNDGTGTFLDGYEADNVNCVDVEMEFNWSLVGMTLNLTYTGIENGIEAGIDGPADPESLVLSHFTGDKVRFPSEEVETGQYTSAILTKILTKISSTESETRSVCSAPGI